MKLKMLGLVLSILGPYKLVFAIADFGPAKVLPHGRHQFNLRFGETSDISQKFDASGSLQSASRMNIRLNKEFLMSQNPQLKQLVEFIDKTYPHMKASSLLDPGGLGFTGDASARFAILQVSRGITSKWSVGVAAPFIDFKTSVRPENLGVNTAPEFFKVASSNNAAISPQIAQGEKLLSEGPVSILNSITDQKGYKRIEPRQSNFLGDVVVGSSYQLTENNNFEAYFLNFLTLPTGPKDDPDDLVDLNIFHKTSLKNSFYMNYKFTPFVEMGMGAFYTFQFEDDLNLRVPTSSADFLPNEDRKVNVNKKPGDIVGFETALIVSPLDRLELGVGYDVEFKQSDNYSGAQDLQYLESNTQTEAHTGRFKFSYTTINSFIDGKSSIPYSFTYAFADTFAGENIERKKTHELLLKFYF